MTHKFGMERLMALIGDELTYQNQQGVSRTQGLSEAIGFLYVLQDFITDENDFARMLRMWFDAPDITVTRFQPRKPLDEKVIEVGQLTIAPTAYSQAKDILMSFKDYMQLSLFESWGFYTSGRTQLDEQGHFITHPIILTPYMGALLAEHAFMMWQGMLRAQTITADEPFSLIEFGAGTGILMRDVLSHIQNRAQDPAYADTDWPAFWQQVQGIIGEQSADLALRQATIAQDFVNQGKLVIYVLDAQEDLSRLGIHKGLVFSNELIDTFASHLLRATPQGEFFARMVIPEIENVVFDFIDDLALRQNIFDEDRKIRQTFAFNGENKYYLSRRSFDLFLNYVWSHDNEHLREFLFGWIHFNEAELPADEFSEAKMYLTIVEDQIRESIADGNEDVLVIANAAAGSYLQQVSAILEKGYVLTIDYGEFTPDLIAQAKEGLPRIRVDHTNVSTSPYKYYLRPGQYDITTDTDFLFLLRVGYVFGFQHIHFGPEFDLALSVPLSPLDVPPTSFRSLAAIMRPSFKFTIQEKVGTDPDYHFPLQETKPRIDRADAMELIGVLNLRFA